MKNKNQFSSFLNQSKTKFIALLCVAVFCSWAVISCRRDANFIPSPTETTELSAAEQAQAIEQAQKWFEQNQQTASVNNQRDAEMRRMTPKWGHAMQHGRNMTEVPFLLDSNILTNSRWGNGTRMGRIRLLFMRDGQTFKVFEVMYLPDESFTGSMYRVNYANLKRRGGYHGTVGFREIGTENFSFVKFDKGKVIDRFRGVRKKGVNDNKESCVPVGQICVPRYSIFTFGPFSTVYPVEEVVVQDGEDCFWVYECNDDPDPGPSGLGSGDCQSNPDCDDCLTDPFNCGSGGGGSGGPPNDDEVTYEFVRSEGKICADNFTFTSINEAISQTQQALITGYEHTFIYESLSGNSRTERRKVYSIPKIYVKMTFRNASGDIVISHADAAIKAAEALSWAVEAVEAEFRQGLSSPSGPSRIDNSAFIDALMRDASGSLNINTSANGSFRTTNTLAGHSPTPRQFVRCD